MSGDSISEGASGDIPQLDLFIIPTFTSKRLAVEAETQPIDFMDVSGKSLLKCASRHIPEAYRVVVTGTSECLPIGTETHARNCVGVSREGIVEFSSADMPEAYRFVLIIGTGECVPIGTETHGVSREGIFECASGDIPKVNSTRRVSLMPYRAAAG